MSERPLVIVESPTKARTIKKFLDAHFIIEACNGHIRDLPNNAAEIPEKYKKTEWARLGVNVDDDFRPLYVVPKDKRDPVKRLKNALKSVDKLYLATDEDREGESISWHLLQELKPKMPVKRLVFHEITKEAIRRALENARELDNDLVRAQETRRIVDRLFGYQVSPLLWRKMSRPGLSAGRVQSVAVRLLVQRERERIAFNSAEFCTLRAELSPHRDEKKSAFEAELYSVGGKRVAIGKDFNPTDGQLRSKANVVALSLEQANELRDACRNQPITVESVEQKPFTTKPTAPFVTSTLQQECNRKFRFSAQRTMSIAQQLYENGHITYMRTDSTTLSDQALRAARNFIQRDYGAEYLPPAPRVYATKVRNAQEAHEAIRPAGEEFAPPQQIRDQLGMEAFKVYELIWKRTVASQMKDAQGVRSSVNIRCANTIFKASGKTISFPGFLRAYVEGTDDPTAELADQEKVLPPLKPGEVLNLIKLETQQKHTQPPARYTEGSLIRELEQRGIGRPSTWANVVSLVLNRDYAFKKANALIPTFTAMAVVGLLEQHFAHFVDYEFTANLEDDLDSIARGEAKSIDYLRRFYFGSQHKGLKDLVEHGADTIDPRIVCAVPIGQTSDGRKVEVRIGRWGPFITDGELRARVPDMFAPMEMTVERAIQLLEESNAEPEILGQDPENNQPIYLKSGPYGPYVQLGEGEKDQKPKRASLLDGMNPDEVTLEVALDLLSLPKQLGKHPENDQDVMVAVGQYGPYVQCGSESRSIPYPELSPLTITFEQALDLLKQPKRFGRRKASASTSSREIGVHPVSAAKITLKSGRYGPYVTDGDLNATLPRGMQPEEVTMDDAIHLLEQKAARDLAQGKTEKKSKTKKAASKKSSSKSKKAAAPKKKSAAQ